jgi:elongation factor P--beta-lysine ligase
MNAFVVGRVIDVHDDGRVTFLSGDCYHTIAWPQEHEKALPSIGDIYHMDMRSSARVVEKIGGCMATDGDKTFGHKDGDAMRWRRMVDGGVSRMHVIKQRHLIKRAVRDYFHDQGFVEIDMPTLMKGTTPEVEIESFDVDDTHYLQSSTEFGIKRMEIGGFDRLYTLTQNFRKGDDDNKRRNPEFTMLEWARVGQDMKTIEQDAQNLFLTAYRALGHNTDILVFNGHHVDLSPPWNRMTVMDAMAKYLGVMPDDFSPASLADAAQKLGLYVTDNDKGDAFYLFTLLMDALEKHLGFDKPVFLTQWPSFQTPSAGGAEKHKGGSVMRSELFIAGVEISDGFPSQTDHADQVQSFEQQQQRRRYENKKPVRLNTRYLDAMQEGLPRGAGMALGFDRLVMVLTGQTDIRSVLALRWDEL